MRCLSAHEVSFQTQTTRYRKTDGSRHGPTRPDRPTTQIPDPMHQAALPRSQISQFMMRCYSFFANWDSGTRYRASDNQTLTLAKIVSRETWSTGAHPQSVASTRTASRSASQPICTLVPCKCNWNMTSTGYSGQKTLCN